MEKHSIVAEVKANLLLSLPLMAAWVIYSLGPFAGTAMIAPLGKDVLAASVLVGTIWIAGITFWIGLFHSVSVLISQQMGANNNEAISEVMGQSLLLNCCAWLPMMGLMLLIPFVVQWSAPNPEILKYATQYSHALMLAVPGLISLVIVEQFLSGIGKTQMSLWISLIEIPIEILFIYIFVFGKLGLPAFGIAGVGYGLACSFTLTSILVFLYLSYASFATPYQIFKYFGTFNWRYCKEMLNIGVPIGLNFFVELLGFTIATYFISLLSNTALAAHQIALQFASVIINIPYALSQATTIRVGMNVGQLDKKGVRYASYVGVSIGFIFSLMILLILVLFPSILLGIDLDVHQHQELVQIASSLLFILGIYQIFDSVRILEAGALRGLKDTQYTMYANVLCFSVLGVLLAYFIGIILNERVQGIWYGLTMGIILAAIILFFRLRKIINQADLAELLKID